MHPRVQNLPKVLLLRDICPGSHWEDYNGPLILQLDPKEATKREGRKRVGEKEMKNDGKV